nr:MAG TPA: hypothetical protein [Microviridae sp.]
MADNNDYSAQALNLANTYLNYGLSQAGNAANSRRAYRYWNRQRDRIRKEALEDYQRARTDLRSDVLQQYQLDVEAKRNAGLNPALGEGQGSVTMSPSPIQTADTSGIGLGSSQVQNDPLLMAKLENIQADTLEKNKNAGKIQSETDLNKQTFDQNLQKFPLTLRILGTDADIRDLEKRYGKQNLKKIKKELQIMDETLQQSQVTTRMMTVDEQYKAVETFLRVMNAYADYNKKLSDIRLNDASATNQRAQASLAPYQAQNYRSQTYLNYELGKTEGSKRALNYQLARTETTKQSLNRALGREANERLVNWRLKNIEQSFQNKIKGYQSSLVDVGVNPDCHNVFASMWQTFGTANKYFVVDPINHLQSVVTDWFSTGITDPGALEKLQKGVSKWNSNTSHSFTKRVNDWHRSFNDWSTEFRQKTDSISLSRRGKW